MKNPFEHNRHSRTPFDTSLPADMSILLVINLKKSLHLFDDTSSEIMPEKMKSKGEPQESKLEKAGKISLHPTTSRLRPASVPSGDKKISH